ncbi:ly6/PLAUR domain-containing protein 4 isoform X2 [Ictidomys tridecemlineatus]
MPLRTPQLPARPSRFRTARSRHVRACRSHVVAASGGGSAPRRAHRGHEAHTPEPGNSAPNPHAQPVPERQLTVRPPRCQPGERERRGFPGAQVGRQVSRYFKVLAITGLESAAPPVSGQTCLHLRPDGRVYGILSLKFSAGLETMTASLYQSDLDPPGTLNTTFLILGCARKYQNLLSDFHHIGSIKVTEVLNIIQKSQTVGAGPSSQDPSWGILLGLLLVFRY